MEIAEATELVLKYYYHTNEENVYTIIIKLL